MHKKLSSPAIIAVAILATALFSGCASWNKRTPTPALKSLAMELKRSRTSGLVDGCVVRDEVARDYVLRKASTYAGTRAAEHLHQQARSSGIELRQLLQAFDCGAIPPEDGKKLEVANNIGDPALGLHAPVPRTGDKLSSNAAEAINRLLVVVSKSPSVEADQPSPLGLDATDLKLLSTTLDADFLLIVQTRGVSVSGVKSTGQALLSLLATFTLTSGSSWASSWNADGVAQTVAAVDLRKGKLAWKKVHGPLRGNPIDKASYEFDAFLSSMSPLLGPSQTNPTRSAGRQPPQLKKTTYSPPPPQATPSEVIAATNFAILSRPMPESKIVARLPAGTVLKVKSEVGGMYGQWWYVKTTGAEGWIPAKPDWSSP